MILIKRVWQNARYTKHNTRLLSVCLVKYISNFAQAFTNCCTHTSKTFLDFTDSFDLICRKFSNSTEDQFGSIFRCLFMNLPTRVSSKSISSDDEDIKSCHWFACIFTCCISFGPFRYLRVKVL